MGVKVKTVTLEDLAGDHCELTVQERPSGQGIVSLRAPNLWLDRASAAFLGNALIHMSKQVD